MPSKKICQNCGSEKLKMPATPWKARFGIFMGHYKCEDCGFEGIAIEADEKAAEKIRQEKRGK